VPAEAALDAQQLKKGIIESTFEDLKLITDIDLAKLVLQQQISIDKELTFATSVKA